MRHSERGTWWGCPDPKRCHPKTMQANYDMEGARKYSHIGRDC
jgi:hypothetical protein